MTQDFDKLISKAAPAVPDSGESRRAAHALLREKMRREDRRVRNRDRRRISVAAVLVFLTVITGQVSQLGSDGFDFELGTLAVSTGESVPTIINKNRGRVGNALPDMTMDDIYELQQQRLLKEGVIENINALSFNGNTPQWHIAYLNNINGKMVHRSRLPDLLSVETQMIARDKIPFLSNELDNLLTLVNNNAITSKRFGVVIADGVSFDVHMWSKEYANWGLVTYYRGFPLQKTISR